MMTFSASLSAGSPWSQVGPSQWPLSSPRPPPSTGGPGFLRTACCLSVCSPPGPHPPLRCDHSQHLLTGNAQVSVARPVSFPGRISDSSSCPSLGRFHSAQHTLRGSIIVARIRFIEAPSQKYAPNQMRNPPTPPLQRDSSAPNPSSGWRCRFPFRDLTGSPGESLTPSTPPPPWPLPAPRSPPTFAFVQAFLISPSAVPGLP